jgi:hypothetical protein
MFQNLSEFKEKGTLLIMTIRFKETSKWWKIRIIFCFVLLVHLSKMFIHSVIIGKTCGAVIKWTFNINIQIHFKFSDSSMSGGLVKGKKLIK